MDTLTSTQVKTSVITSTKLLAVTAVMLASGAAAFIVAPIMSKPDLTPSNPAPQYSSATQKLTFSWKNIGNATAKFTANQPIYSVDAIGADGAIIGSPSFHRANATFVTKFTAGGLYSNVLSYTPPAGAKQLSITLDPNNIINESDENNNKTRVNLPLADLTFSPTVNPTYSANTLIFTWGNQGTAPARFLTGQPVYKVEAVDATGATVGSPLSLSAGNDGSGGTTYAIGQKNTVTMPFTAPTGAVKIRITLDHTGLITELSEDNNVYLLDLPLPDLGFPASPIPRFEPGVPNQLIYTWGNLGNAMAYLQNGQVLERIQALDNTGTELNDPSYGTRNLTVAVLAGYPAGFIVQRTQTWPEGVAKYRITLDPNNAITELNELNNIYLVERPVATTTPPIIIPTSTPLSCTDTDGGANRNVFGEVRVVNGENSTNVSDGCFSTLVVAEAVCVPTSTLGYAIMTLRCALDKVCSFGACISTSTTPTPTSTPPEATSTPPV